MHDPLHTSLLARRRAGALAAVAVAAALVAGSCTTDPETGGAAPAMGDPVAAAPAGATTAAGDLFVVPAGEASLTAPDADGAQELSLSVDGPVLAFTDRPARGAERITAADLVARWASLGFVADPPNAALTGTGADGADVDVAVELTDPGWDPATSTLRVTVRTIGADLGAALPTRLTDVSLFIDDAADSAELTLSVNGGPALTVAGIESTPVDQPFAPSGTEVQGNGNGAWTGQDGWLEVGQVLTQAGSFGDAMLMVQNPAPGQQVTLTLTLATQAPAEPTPPPPPGGPTIPPPPPSTVEYQIAYTFFADGGYDGTVTVPSGQLPGTGLDTANLSPAGSPDTYVFASSDLDNAATLNFQ